MVIYLENYKYTSQIICDTDNFAVGVASYTQPGSPNAGAPAAVPPMQQPMRQVQKKRARSNAIPIIGPFTDKKLSFDEESQPPSGPDAYVQQQAPAQVSNQGSSNRGDSGGGDMPPTGLPNQSSTPPQSELKAPPQPDQTSGGPHIPNHQRHTVATSAAVAAAGSMQQMYPPVPIFSGPPAQAYQVPFPYNNPTRPPVYFPQTYPATMLPGAQFFNNTYTGQQPAQHLFYPGGPMPMQGRPGPNAAGVTSGTRPGAPAVVPPMQQPMPKVLKKRVQSLTIIDPFTGKEVTCDELQPPSDTVSIVKDEPRPKRPVLKPPPATQDETERVAAEIFTQAKKEANTIRTNADNNETQSNDKTIVRYKKNQWSPRNTEGKKCYDRDFLICLQNTPNSKKMPDNLPDLEVVLNAGELGGGSRSRLLAGRPFGGRNRQPESLMLIYHKSLSPRGPLPKRNSQQGKVGGGGGRGKAGGNKPNPIHMTLSLREDVKLRETENACQPARLNASTSVTEHEAKPNELYKKVRGVLNKLSPEKFDKLVNQAHALNIDNADRRVMDLVLKKAVDAPNFSVAYALMCKELALMQVPSTTKKDDQMEYVNFRKLLINRCHLEFEKNSVDQLLRNAKIKEIEECTDQVKKKELQLVLDEDVRRVHIRSVGTIRFIGELFKQQMLTVKFMIRFINILLENNDEDSLECLCKLLTTKGKDLEVVKNQNLQPFFNIMEDIVKKKPSKINSRVFS